LPRFAPVTITALLATLVFIFAFQADNITNRPFHVLLIAVPITLQVYFNASLVYGLMKLLKVEHSVAAPGALIGASNFFELAVATAIALFGPQSGAALATVVGCAGGPVRPPVMLSVCAACNRTRHWFSARTMSKRTSSVLILCTGKRLPPAARWRGHALLIANDAPAGNQLQAYLAIQLGGPVDGHFDTPSRQQDAFGGEQNAVAAHVDGLAGAAFIAGPFAQDLVSQVALDREPVGRASLVGFFSILHLGLVCLIWCTGSERTIVVSSHSRVVHEGRTLVPSAS
jgi:hypothetical protein